MLIDHNKLIHFGPDFPTFISHNKPSAPDIILSNNKTYHNINITQGLTTPSDHLPILINITSHALQTPTPTTYSMKKANWEEFQNNIPNRTNNINTNAHMTQHTLDTSIQQ